MRTIRNASIQVEQLWRPRLFRGFHATALTSKNPYYFYDLAAKQPRSSTRTLTFDPTKDSAGLPSMEERVKMVFGELGSRDASKKEADLRARTVGGVRIPAKPEEPTNCCMSGCVNCVWELYKDEMEEWKVKRHAAKLALLTKPEYRSEKWPRDFGPEPDRRGSEVEVSRQLHDDEDSDYDMDVGIRVFVQTEKKIRKRASDRSRLRRQEPIAPGAPA